MKINTGLINERLIINKTYNYSDKIIDRNDIIDIKPCHVTGVLEFIDNATLEANLAINCNMTLASSRSLKPVDYELGFNIHLLFGDDKEADFVLSDEILLADIIYGHILSEKPPTIYLEDELEETIKEVKKVNPAFKELVNWQK